VNRFAGLTVEEIAARTAHPSWKLQELLDEEVGRGVLELVDGRYRFTSAGWDDVGEALALLTRPGMVIA
jgi:hypothetical protein